MRYGCTQPVFTLDKTDSDGNLTDVVVEYQVWTPSV
jgi:hypothetical protein